MLQPTPESSLQRAIPCGRPLEAAFRGRYFEVKGWIVAVGAGVVRMWRGDACVALRRRGKRSCDQDAGDHKRPRPAQPFPRPYGHKAASEAMSHNIYP
jgi:hypothetical protein